MVEASCLGLSHLVTHRLYPVGCDRLAKYMITVIRVLVIRDLMIDILLTPFHILLGPEGLALLLIVEIIHFLIDIRRFKILLWRSEET